MSLSACPASREERRAVVHRGDARPLWLHVEGLELVEHLKHEHQLAVGSASAAVHIGGLAVELLQGQEEAAVGQLLVVVDFLLVLLPRLAVGRVGNHIPERAVGEVVDGKCVAAVDAVGVYVLDDEV